ncbi:MAG: hypothetical protein VYA55_07745 [Pseudomonadota bacterium]|nr:hypothetical protein [Pseudomonadota bacterium]
MVSEVPLGLQFRHEPHRHMLLILLVIIPFQPAYAATIGSDGAQSFFLLFVGVFLAVPCISMLVFLGLTYRYERIRRQIRAIFKVHLVLVLLGVVVIAFGAFVDSKVLIVVGLFVPALSPLFSAAQIIDRTNSEGT